MIQVSATTSPRSPETPDLIRGFSGPTVGIATRDTVNVELNGSDPWSPGSWSARSAVFGLAADRPDSCGARVTRESSGPGVGDTTWNPSPRSTASPGVFFGG